MKSIGTLTLWATLVHRCLGFSITASNDANVLANAMFTGPGITIVSASYTGSAASSGSYIDGPFGISTGAILTTGTAVGALPNGDHYVNNGQPGSSTYCGPSTFNAAILSVDILVGVGYNGLNFEYIMASEEEGGSSDPVGIFVDSTAYARDPDGNPLTATTPWLANPLVIVPPKSVTSYPGSTPPFIRAVVAATGSHTVVIAICDKGDSEWDSALLIRAGGCTDCDPDVRLDYVTSTVTTTTTGTSTVTASGTVSGTLIVSVTAETTTTTAEETTTTTEAETTTTTAETTTEETTTTTAETTTEETTTTTAETTTETTTAETTTAETTTEETTTTTAETTTETTTEETTTTAETTTTEETTTTAETTTETTTSEETTTTTTEATTTTEESTTTTEESTTTLETTTETTTSVDTTTETSTELTTTETTTELSTTSDETTSTEESTTETTETQSTETTTSLTTETTTSTESPTTTESVTSTEPSTSLESSEISSTQSSDATSQTTTSIELGGSSDTTTQESTLESMSTSTVLQLSSDESSSTETLSTDAELPTVVSVESSTTENTQPPPATSAETFPSTSTQLLPVMNTETSSTMGIEESTSEVIPPESSSLEPSIPTLEPTTSDSLFTESETPAPPSDSTTEPVDTSSAETPSAEPSVSETVITVIPLPPSASSASGTSTEAAAASNLPVIRNYEFFGCVGSRQSYPTFEELLTDPEMTTSRCIELAAGRKYVGLYFRSCYVADELTDTGLVRNGQCDLPCPGDPGLFCGGNVVDRRRAIPSDRLLTLYALTQAVDSSSIEVIPSTSEPLIPSSLEPGASPTSIVDIVPTFDPSSVEVPSSIPPSEESTADNLPIPFPTQGPSPPKGFTFNITQTVDATYTSTVTTVVYQTINAQDPEYLTVTEVVVTIGYYPCGRCAVQPIPPVEMTTIVEPCKACGWQGADSVTLTIPKAACTADAGDGAAQGPDGWRRPLPHNAAGGVHWGAEAKATELPMPDHGNQNSPPPGNDRYPAEHDQQRPVATHQAQPAPDAHLPPAPPAKAEHVNPEVPAASEPTQSEGYVWDDQDEYGSRQPSAISTQAAPKTLGGSDGSDLPTQNNPWGPTETTVVVAKGAVNGINGFMMATLALLVIFY